MTNDDTDFMEGMKTLLGFDEEQVEKLLDTLDKDSVVALADAVTNEDKQAAEDIIGSFENQLSSLFHKQEDDGTKKEKPKKKKPVRPPKSHEFAIGDDVAIKVKDKDTDKTSFVSATVSKPKAPGNTIGVKIDGKTKMVDKKEVYTLKEMIMGMTGIPDLQRMQQLAGIQPQVTVEPFQEPDVQPSMNTNSMEDTMDDVSQAISALDTLEEVLPNIRLADLKNIRQRIYDIQRTLNESIVVTEPTGRSRKL